MSKGQWVRLALGGTLFVAAASCGRESSGEGEWSEASAALATWASGNFSQVLRVNAGEAAVRNRCELTVRLPGPTPLTFIGSDAGGTLTTPLGWKGNAESVAGLSVTACAAYPCEVTALWRTTEASESAVGCQIVADDAASRFIGASTGTALTVPQPPAAPIIFHQHLNFDPSGNATAAECVLRQSASLGNAQVSAFQVHVNGVQEAFLTGPIPIGSVTWPTKGPAIDFGTLYMGTEAAATRLKHVAARKEQLTEGDALRCAGQFSVGATPVFDVNVNAAPAGNGMSLVVGPTEWTCSATMFGTGDGCDCGCGIVDPDCSVGECGETITEVCAGALPQPPQGQLCSVIAGNADKLLIRGNVLGSDMIHQRGAVLVTGVTSGNGTIACTGCDCAASAAAQGATVVSCPNGIVSPGLINAHEHLNFSAAGPVTTAESERYDHRHDWRTGSGGHTTISVPSMNSTQQLLWTEIRHLMAGTTSMVGNGSVAGLVRNLEALSNRQGLPSRAVDVSTFPLGDIGGQLLTDSCAYPAIEDESVLAADCYSPHIAEGVNAAAQNEFVCTSDTVLGSDLLEQNTALVHGIALTEQDVSMMAGEGVSLVWSPRSNIRLYGDTARVLAHRNAGVNIALSTDWAPTGSMNLQRELACADSYNQNYLSGAFSDRDLWEMVTRDAAASLLHEDLIGTLSVGSAADIVVFANGSQGYRAVIESGAADVVLVLRGGVPLYGDQTLVESLRTDEASCDVLDVCGTNRLVCIAPETAETLASLQLAVTTAGTDYPLFFCGTPTNEPTCVPSRPGQYDGIPAIGDQDGDGIADAADLCPDVFDAIRVMDANIQPDADDDGSGDACDPCPFDGANACSPTDLDADGVHNAADNCPSVGNPNQDNLDGDGLGDACDPCPDHAGSPCPSTIYDLKQGLVPLNSKVLVGNVVVTAANATGAFLQVHPGDPDYADANYSGLYVYLGNFGGTKPVAGDRIDVLGTLIDYFGQIQISPVTSLVIQSQGNPLPVPIIVTPTSVATGGASAGALEGVLLQVENVQVTSLETFNEFIVDNTLRVDDFFYLVTPYPTVGTFYTQIVGVLRFANADTKLEPRNAADISW